MRSLVRVTLLCALPLGAALAQLPDAGPQPTTIRHHPHGNPHKAALRMSRRLNLSPDQLARVEPVLAARRQKADVVRANAQLSERERHQQLKAIRRESGMAMSGVLTPDQMQQLKAMHHGRHASSTPHAGV